MRNGWIKLHRSLLDWEWYDDINVMRVFLHCLLMANHKDKKYRGAVVERGSFLTGRDTLASQTGLTVQQIRTSLNKLKSTNELTIKSSKQGTVIQVVSYDKYQEVTNESTTHQPDSNQIVTTNKKNKNIKNEKKNTLADAETHEISWSSAGGWQNISADDIKQWGVAYPNAHVAQQIEAMNQWLISNPSKAKKKLWRKFITNWLARQQTTASRPQQKSFAEINAEAKKEIYRKNMKNMLW
jgi:predicted transcriptional regulator